jgi:GPH family glycoside/pentoside/hexuronide:cation symporter
MIKEFHFNILKSSIFDSRIKSENVSKAERWLGFIVAPSVAACMFAICGQAYLNVFYTDVLKLSPVMGGVFLAAMPIVTRIINAVTNLIMGRMLDNTFSSRGKARPWLLIAGPLLAVSGILLFIVPSANITIQVIWVIASYNLFFCISYTVYNISNTILVPLATRDIKQRDTLSIASSMSISFIPGIIIWFLFPKFLLPYMGIEQNKWILIMSIISVLCIPSVLLQYYFTRERITENYHSSETEKQPYSLREQFKGCLSSKNWVIIMGIIFIYQTINNFFLSSLLYYSNWVLGTYNDGKTLMLLNVIGQFPLALGLLFLANIVKKIGKINTMFIGGVLLIFGSIFGFLFPKNMELVLTGMVIRSFGNIPFTYILLAMLADSLDHVESVNGFRCDGFSSSVFSIISTVCSGLAIGLFNLLLGVTGYIAPATDVNMFLQNTMVQRFFIYGVFMVPAVGVLFINLLLIFYKNGKMNAHSIVMRE